MPLKRESLKRGFTLVELMAAVACAAILAASAWTSYGLFMRGRQNLLLSYQRDSRAQIQDLQNAKPYDSRTGHRRNPMFAPAKQ